MTDFRYYKTPNCNRCEGKMERTKISYNEYKGTNLAVKLYCKKCDYYTWVAVVKATLTLGDIYG